MTSRLAALSAVGCVARIARGLRNGGCAGMTPRCAAQALALIVLSSVVAAAQADDLWFQPDTPPASDNAPAPQPPAAIVLGAVAVRASRVAVRCAATITSNAIATLHG
jgi:hypothetical protein